MAGFFVFQSYLPGDNEFKAQPPIGMYNLTCIVRPSGAGSPEGLQDSTTGSKNNRTKRISQTVAGSDKKHYLCADF